MFQKNKILIAVILGIAVYFLYKQFTGGTGKGKRSKLMRTKLLDSGYYNRFAAKFKGKLAKLSSSPLKGYYAAEIPDSKRIDGIVDRIFDAKSPILGIGDKDETVLSVFSNLNSQVEVAWIAKRFNELKKRNLADYLDFMKNDNMGRINEIIEALPTGLYKGNGSKWVEVAVFPNI